MATELLIPERSGAALISAATDILLLYTTAGLRLATAESCTGGLIAAALTAPPGASRVIECGFVTYSNHAKTALLGVPEALLAAHGAVSPEVAAAMARGALARAAGADITVAVTGIAGPDGGSPEKPVGLVYLATACRCDDALVCQRHIFAGDRTAIRHATVLCALGLLRAAVPSAQPDRT